MDFSKLSSLTGGGGLDAGSSAGGNDQLTGGANINFGYLPPLPTMPGMPNTSSVSVQSSGGGVWLLAAVGVAVALFMFTKKRG
ncbi:hypothetical protein [Marinomonas algicola]|uniref:hypothetical protein n=1 Tax=Marinomonas algicola TaxID=2773454 RepID=UPI001749A227|nr:hypothetical protein [Marinomonas algicola]